MDAPADDKIKFKSEAEPPKTPFIGPLSVDGEGRLVLRYVDTDGQRITMDLTREIERIAALKVAEHMKSYHGHQL